MFWGCMKKTYIKLTFLILIGVNNCYANTAEEELAKLCFGVAQSISIGGEALYAKAEKQAGLSTNNALMWEANWFGRNVPIPIVNDGWKFQKTEIFSGLYYSNPEVKITFGAPMFEAQESDILSMSLDKFQMLPKPSLSKFELLKLAVRITPDDVNCDTENIQKTINELAALLMKGFELFEGDKPYFMPNGDVLIHRVYEKGELWRYIFTTKGSDLAKKVEIQHWTPGEYSNIGFQIHPRKNYSYSRGEPLWLSESLSDSEKTFPKTISEYLKEKVRFKENLRKQP